MRIAIVAVLQSKKILTIRSGEFWFLFFGVENFI